MLARRVPRAVAVLALLAAAACLQLHARLVVRRGSPPLGAAEAFEGAPADVGGDLRVALLQRSARLGAAGAAPRGPAALSAPGGPAGAPRASPPPAEAPAPAAFSGEARGAAPVEPLAAAPRAVAPAGPVGAEAIEANGSPSPTSPLPSLPLPALTIQLLFAIFYYFLILRKYPKLPEDAQISREVVRFQESCVIAQDAIALDMIVGARTKICSVDTVS